MGLFDGFKSKVQPTFNTQKAIMTIVIAAIKADGNVSDEEVVRLRSMCARSPIFASNSREEDDAVIDFALNVSDQLGQGAISQAAQALKPALRETAFAFATEMILADGMVGSKEEDFISKLADSLGVTEETGKAIIMVTLIRGRDEQ
jgi:uncharacterized tellurite resistance protein B-like protein